MNKSLRIGLVDDKAVNRSSIADKIKQFEDLNFCFMAVNGNDCLEQLKGLPVEKMPQVIFMDLEMPEMDGVQTISLARLMYPDIFFIVLTVFDDDDKIFEAIKAGAHGYLLKDESAIALHNAITNVVESGGAPMSPAIARKAFEMLSKSHLQTETKASEPHLLDTLVTEREKEILLHTINGHDAKRIAAILDISVLTIRKHIANIYQKLHVNSKAQIISLAHKNNWV
ncbi:MAG: response regulator transcription factor [Ferruginibacter sp.]|nr:response regulator transcription factor [Chitinophagaceae bacterium]MBP6287864.1 response regulator transcription factor [Ferruginibacter sp.]MBU9936291.1 response regulator transcription factor [Ferruginibacter sp.]